MTTKNSRKPVLSSNIRLSNTNNINSNDAFIDTDSYVIIFRLKKTGNCPMQINSQRKVFKKIDQEGA